jgi:hypothetical protein
VSVQEVSVQEVSVQEVWDLSVLWATHLSIGN